MIVVDASFVVAGLLDAGAARESLRTDTTVVPCIADAEIASALRRHVRYGSVSETHARAALRRWAALGVQQFPVRGLLDRVWALRDNLSAYDAAYVALAETLEVPLHTADARLAAAPGPLCPVVVVR